MLTPEDHTCKDCREACRVDHPKKSKTVRKAVYPGPRCYQHHIIEQKRLKARSRASAIEKTYGVTPMMFERLKEYQRGVCIICRVATGRTKALAVDHDHRHCPGRTGCIECVRGLACGPCNQMLGRLRDDPDAFQRAADYLRTPVAVYALAREQQDDGTWGWKYPIPERTASSFIPDPRMPIEGS